MEKKAVWLAVVFGLGAYGYGLIEVLWRGFTHWSMCLTGGACLAAFFLLEPRLRHTSLFLRSLLGSGLITAFELMVGVVVNLKLHWQVWDYSGHLFHLWGQICPLFSGCWFLLSAPAFWVCGAIRRKNGTSAAPALRPQTSPGRDSGRTP